MEACSASPKSGISPFVDNHYDATEQTELSYQVRIENFEGPLDLLLHLIKKSEINIYDIPIHLIAQQYLTYIEAMEDLNLTVAGEFLVMAATLLQIKSKMLLPADETAVDEEDGPDPREELVRRLLEYKKFKDAARQLDEQERLWREIYSREQSPDVELKSDETLLDNVSLFDLVDVLQGILARNPGKTLNGDFARQLDGSGADERDFGNLGGAGVREFCRALRAVLPSSCYHCHFFGVAGTHTASNGSGVPSRIFWADSRVARLLTRTRPGRIR